MPRWLCHDGNYVSIPNGAPLTLLGRVAVADSDTPALADAAAELYLMATGEDLESGSRAVLAEMLAVDPDGHWTHRVYHRATGQLLAARAFVGLFLLDEQLIWSFHKQAPLLDVFRHTAALLDGSDALRGQVSRIRRTNGEQQIEMRSGARLLFINRLGGRGGRGISADCHLLDGYLGEPLTAPDTIPDAILNGATRRNPQVVVSP